MSRGLRRWISTCGALAALGTATTLHAQSGKILEGEVMIGLAGQSDSRKVDHVRIWPVGLNFGFVVQPLFGRRNLSIVEQVSFYPFSAEPRSDEPMLPFTRNNPFILNTLWMRAATGEPEVENRMVFFGGAGIALPLISPRSGDRLGPMIGVGVRRWSARGMGFELSLQCSAMRIGRMVCQLPFTSVWPFRNKPTD